MRLEDAVRKMTSLNAAKAGIIDRGILRPGLFADLTLFDPAKVIDRNRPLLEPFHSAPGIRFVMVNGKLVLEDGRHNVLIRDVAIRNHR